MEPPTPPSIFIDLSHTIMHGLVTYKGLPAPLICDYLSRKASRSKYEAGTEFQIGKIEMVANTGTYLDSPFHRFAHGKDLSELELAALVDLPGLVIRRPFSQSLAVEQAHLQPFAGLIRGRAVLVNTGWDQHWNTEWYYDQHPSHCRGGAVLAGRRGQTGGHRLPQHRRHNGQPPPGPHHFVGGRHSHRGAPLPPVGTARNRVYFHGSAPKFQGVGTFPVRAFAKVRK